MPDIDRFALGATLIGSPSVRWYTSVNILVRVTSRRIGKLRISSSNRLKPALVSTQVDLPSWMACS